MLEPKKYYHIYNRANGFENLFVNEGNYEFFLNKIAQYLNPVLDLRCYCLMPNHFHLLVQIKREEEVEEAIKINTPNYTNSQTYLKFQTLDRFIPYYISKQFSSLFSSYCQAFNKQQNRTGSLFQKGFKHKEVNSEEYLKELVLYIHCNAVHHGFVKNFSNWKHTSYETIINKEQSEVIKCFDDIDNFIACYQDKNEFNKIDNLILE